MTRYIGSRVGDWSRSSDEGIALSSFTPDPADHKALMTILQDSGYDPAPDFIIWGRLPLGSQTSMLRVGALGVFVLVGFESMCLHIIGRSERESDLAETLPSQAVIREIAYQDVKSVALNSAGGLGGLLTLNIGESSGLLTEALGEANARLALSKQQVAGQRELIDQLKNRVAAAEQRNESTAPAGDQSLASQLAELAELRASGVLDEDEFRAAKKKLLG